MGLLDDLTDPVKLRGQIRVQCSVCLLLKALDFKEAEKLASVIEDGNVKKAAVARILQDNGYKIGADAITRHARRECSRN
jgi:hypothetical protein